MIKQQQSIPELQSLVAIKPQNNPSGALSVIPEQKITGCMNDYRFKRLMIQGARKFPSSQNDYYGLVFTNADDPVSSVFLGSNGVGKSSLYASLEYATLNHIYSADARGYEQEEEQKLFLRNASSTQNPLGRLETVDKDIKIPLNERNIGLASFFCSEYDIQYLEHHDVTPEYIFKQVGLWEIKQLIDLLNRACNVGDLQLNLKICRERIAQMNSLEDKDKLEKLKKDEYNLKYRLECELNSQDGMALDAFQFPVEWTDKARQVIDYLKGSISDELEPLYSLIEKTLPLLLKDNLVNQEYVEVSRNEDNLNILIHADEKAESQPLSPRAFFNTFRFKLYCVVLKFCLAYGARTLNHMNFPIVIDDVFDSSDFDNRHRIYGFIEKLINEYQKLDKAKDYPLQVIFFSQDELVSKGVYHGLRNVMSADKVKFGRIYDFTEAKEKDKTSVRILMDQDKFINLEDCIIS
jgi:hypothetical protein